MLEQGPDAGANQIEAVVGARGELQDGRLTAEVTGDLVWAGDDSAGEMQRHELELRSIARSVQREDRPGQSLLDPIWAGFSNGRVGAALRNQRAQCGNVRGWFCEMAPSFRRVGISHGGMTSGGLV